MKKYRTQITQIIIMTIIITFYYINASQTEVSLVDVFDDDINVIIKYGKSPGTFSKPEDKDVTLFYTNANLDTNEKLKVESTILGDTISSSENKIYYNNFENIYAVDSNKEETYTSVLDDYILNVIYDKPIYIDNVYATDSYYHSVAHVELESTINYPVDASIITQIVDGHRYDTLVYEDVHALSYDEENNEFYIFYSTSSSGNSVYMFNELVSSKLIYDNETNEFLQESKQVTQGHKLSSHGVVHIDPIIKDRTLIYFTEEVGLSDRRVVNYSVGNFNTSTSKIEDERLMFSKQIMNDSFTDISTVIHTDSKLYVFFTDLRYNVVDLETYSTTEYIIANTGKISSITYASNNDKVYTVFDTDTTINIALIEEGVLVNREIVTKTDFGFGFINYESILELQILPK